VNKNLKVGSSNLRVKNEKTLFYLASFESTFIIQSLSTVHQLLLLEGVHPLEEVK
jgi:hypothetical protein